MILSLNLWLFLLLSGLERNVPIIVMKLITKINIILDNRMSQGNTMIFESGYKSLEFPPGKYLFRKPDSTIVDASIGNHSSNRRVIHFWVKIVDYFECMCLFVSN